jgi:transcriptional regulator with XRE-family HTH domain
MAAAPPPQIQRITRVKIYGSYSFIDKDPVIDALRTAIQHEKATYAQIEQKSGVTDSTLRNWFEGKTKRPQYCTVAAVWKALGYEPSWQKKPRKR